MAHTEVRTLQLGMPIIGHPGTGYESVIDALEKLDQPVLKWDRLGSRTSTLLPEQWTYDPMFLWRKALQESENERDFFFSAGGQNWYEIAALRWPMVFILRPLRWQLWRDRVMAWRKANAPELGPLTITEVDDYKRSVYVANTYLSDLPSRSGIRFLDSEKSPEDIAEHILKLVRTQGPYATP